MLSATYWGLVPFFLLHPQGNVNSSCFSVLGKLANRDKGSRLRSPVPQFDEGPDSSGLQIMNTEDVGRERAAVTPNQAQPRAHTPEYGGGPVLFPGLLRHVHFCRCLRNKSRNQAISQWRGSLSKTRASKRKAQLEGERKERRRLEREREVGTSYTRMYDVCKSFVR